MSSPKIASAFREKRIALGLSVAAAAEKAGISEADVVASEMDSTLGSMNFSPAEQACISGKIEKLIGEGKTHDQAVAEGIHYCSVNKAAYSEKDISAYKLAKALGVYIPGEPAKEFGELRGMEVFATGIHKGTEFTVADLDRMVANFNSLSSEVKPPMVLGHDEASPIVKNSGLPALGWVSALRREGEKLVADFADVPELMKQALNQKRYKRVSIALYPNYTDSRGISRGMTLRHVGILGADIPEVKSLQDIVALDKPELVAAGKYISNPEGFESYFAEADAPASQGKETGVTKEELEKMQADQTKAFDEQLSKALEAQKALFDEALKVERAERAKDADKIKTLTETLAKSEVEKRSAESLAFVTALTEKGILLPKHKDAGIVSFMDRLDNGSVVKFAEGKEQSPLAWFKEFVSALPPVVRLGKEDAAGGGVGKGTVKFAGQEHEVSDNSAELAKLIEKELSENAALQKMKPGLAYAEATKIVSGRRPELVKM